jgi:branched-chain amino acid transport system permease protein
VIDFLQYSFNGLLTGMLYAMIALAFIVIYRAARIFNFAQGEIVMVGGFFIWWLILGTGLPVWLGLPLALVGAAVMGVLVERIFFRPIIGQPLFSLVMVTIGLLILLRGIVLVIWGPQPRPFPTILPRPPLELGPFLFNQGLFWGGIFGIVAVAGLNWFFSNTKWGLQLTAVAENHQVAQSLGISVKRAIAIAWAISAVLSAIAAVSFLNAKSMNFLAADIGLRAVPVALLAGVESIGGVALAGAIIGLAEAWAGAYLDERMGGGVSAVLPFILMLLIVLFKPTGLFGWKTIERV